MADEVVLPAPTAETLEKLKSTYGKIYRVVLNVDEVFYIRRIKRAEYKRILEVVGKSDPVGREDLLNEKLVETAVVWSSPEINEAFYANIGAGVVPTIAIQIMDRSGFTQQVAVDEM